MDYIIKKLVVLSLVALLPAAVSAKTLRLKVRNLGDNASIRANHSYSGGLIFNFEPLQFNTDSVAVITPGDADVEIVNIALGGTNSVYLTADETEVCIDPSQGLILSSKGTSPETTAAIAAVRECYEKHFIGHVTHKSNSFGLRSDTVAVSIKEKLMNYADSVTGLLQVVAEPLRSVLRQDLALCILRLWNEVTARRDGDEWSSARAELVEWAGMDNAYNSLSKNFSTIARTDFFLSLLDTYKPEAIRRFKPQRLKKLQYDYIKRRFTGKNRETLLADLIHSDVAESRFTSGIDSLATDFRAEYPQSAFLPVIEVDMIKFGKVNANKDNSEIVFIDSAEIPSLEKLIARFEGHPVLLDIWATWCGPCRASFAHIKPIQDYARDHDINLVYISIDEENSALNVEKLAKYYNLIGHHVIASSALNDDLFKILWPEGTRTIPRTILYARDGRPIHDHIDVTNTEMVIDLLKKLQ